MLVAIILFIVLCVLVGLYALLSLFVNKVLHNDLGILARILSGMLVLQYILGMLANLYQTIPDKESYIVFHTIGYIWFHSLNGALLVLLAIIFHVRAIKTKQSIMPSVIGLTAIVLATVCGIIFVDSGGNAIFSFIMSIAFLIAFGNYVTESYRAFMLKRHQ